MSRYRCPTDDELFSNAPCGMVDFPLRNPDERPQRDRPSVQPSTSAQPDHSDAPLFDDPAAGESAANAFDDDLRTDDGLPSAAPVLDRAVAAVHQRA